MQGKSHVLFIGRSSFNLSYTLATTELGRNAGYFPVSLFPPLHHQTSISTPLYYYGSTWSSVTSSTDHAQHLDTHSHETPF